MCSLFSAERSEMALPSRSNYQSVQICLPKGLLDLPKPSPTGVVRGPFPLEDIAQQVHSSQVSLSRYAGNVPPAMVEATVLGHTQPHCASFARQPAVYSRQPIGVAIMQTQAARSSIHRDKVDHEMDMIASDLASLGIGAAVPALGGRPPSHLAGAGRAFAAAPISMTRAGAGTSLTRLPVAAGAAPSWASVPGAQLHSSAPCLPQSAYGRGSSVGQDSSLAGLTTRSAAFAFTMPTGAAAASHTLGGSASAGGSLASLMAPKQAGLPPRGGTGVGWLVGMAGAREPIPTPAPRADEERALSLQALTARAHCAVEAASAWAEACAQTEARVEETSKAQAKAGADVYMDTGSWAGGWRPSRSDLVQPVGPEAAAAVATALASGDKDVLIRAFRREFEGWMIKQLKPREWLRDDVINMYITLLRERNVLLGDHVWIATTQFWPQMNNNTYEPSTRAVIEEGYCYADVRMYTSVGSRVKARPGQIDVFAKKLVLVPINYTNSHWALAALDLEKHEAVYYDSLPGVGRGHHVCAKLLRWLGDEHVSKKGKPLDMASWGIRDAPGTLPRQKNGFDCGVFTCLFADFLSAGFTPDSSVDFTQESIPQLRIRMAAAILAQRLPEVPEELLLARGLGSKAPDAK